MTPISRRLIPALAFLAVCLPSVVHGAGIAAPGESRAAFSPTAFASSISGLFNSPSPDLTALNPFMSSLKGVDLSDPKTRAALDPVFAAVQAQVRTLQANAAPPPGAPADPALATKYIAAGILTDFQLPETRSRVAELSRAYHDALPADKKEEIRAALVMLDMKSMIEALGGTDGARAGVVAADDGVARRAHSIPDSWKLRPSNGGIKDIAADYRAAPGGAREINAVLAGAAAVSGKPLSVLSGIYEAGRAAPEVRAILAAAVALSEGKPLSAVSADYEATPALSPEIRAGLAAAAAVSDKPLSGVIDDFNAGPVSTPEIRVRLAAAAAVSGKAIRDISADYEAGPKSTPEARSILAAAAAISGLPLREIVALYEKASPDSPETREVLTAEAAISGKLEWTVIADYTAASTSAIRASLAAAAAISGKPLKKIIADYATAPASTAAIRATLASAAAFSRMPRSQGRILFIQLPKAVDPRPKEYQPF